MAALAAAQVKDKAERVNVLLAPITVIDKVQELLNAPLPATAILAVAGKVTVDLGGELLGHGVYFVYHGLVRELIAQKLGGAGEGDVVGTCGLKLEQLAVAV